MNHINKRTKDKKPRKRRSTWTPQEEAYLLANYAKYTNKDLAHALNKSERGIILRAKLLNIPNKVEQQKTLTLWDRRDAVINTYKSTNSIVVTARKYEVSFNTIKRLLERAKAL